MFLPLCTILNGNMPLCQMAQYIGAPILYGGSRAMGQYYLPQMYMQPCPYCPYAMQQKNNPGHNNPASPNAQYGVETPQYFEGDYTGDYQPYPTPIYPPGQFGGPHGLPIRNDAAAPGNL